VQVVPKPEGAKRRGTPENDIWLHIPLNEVSHPEAKSDPISFDWNFIMNCYVNIESLSIRGGHKHRKEKVPYGASICKLHPNLKDKKIPEERMYMPEVRAIGDKAFVLYWPSLSLGTLRAGVIVHQASSKTYAYGFTDETTDAFSSHINGTTFLLQYTVAGIKLLVITLTEEGGPKTEELSLKHYIDANILVDDNPLEIYPTFCVAQHEDRLIFTSKKRTNEEKEMLLWIRLGENAFKKVPLTIGISLASDVDTFDNVLVQCPLDMRMIEENPMMNVDSLASMKMWSFNEDVDEYLPGAVQLLRAEGVEVSLCAFVPWRLWKLGNDYFCVLHNGQGSNLSIYQQAAISGAPSDGEPFIVKYIQPTDAIQLTDAIMCDQSRRLFLATSLSHGKYNYVIVLDMKKCDSYFDASDNDMIGTYEIDFGDDDSDGITYIEVHGKNGQFINQLYLSEGLLYIRFGREFEIYNV
jgi:hypothetical protein